MTYGRDRYGGAAYGGSTLAPARRAGSGLGLPGYAAAYYWYDRSATPAYGGAAYGGRRASAYPAAGLLAFPDPAAGAVSLTAWWAFADIVTVARIEPDGTRSPLRDSPVQLDRARSRRNGESNPKARDTLTGLAAGTNTTVSRLTGLVLPAPFTDRVTTAFRGTATAAGAATLNNTVDAVATGTSTKAFLVRTSALATGIAYTVTWYDTTGAVVTTTSHPASAAVPAAAAAGWTWATVTISSPARAATGAGGYTATGLPAGATLDITARVSERGATVGSYFDGDDPYAQWIGAAGLSLSDLAAPAFLVDAEAPLDTPVTYELSAAAASGYVAVTDAVSLRSADVFAVDPAVPAEAADWGAKRRALLTHPGLSRTFGVWIERAPATKNAIDQTAHKLPGRRNKVVYSADGYDGDEGEFTFVCETAAERARLRSVLDGSPLLLRSPADYGYPPAWWLSFGDVDTEPLSHDARLPVRKLTVPFVEVDRPVVATRPRAAA